MTKLYNALCGAVFLLLALAFVMLVIGGVTSLFFFAARAVLLAVGLPSGLLASIVSALAGFIGLIGLLLFGAVAKHKLGRRPLRRIKSALGLGYGVAELAKRLDLDASTLMDFQPCYSPSFIPKRNGGTRKLLIPDAPTRDLQRRILRRLLSRLKAHEAAHAYERGRSVATNAALHSRQQVVLKMDLKDFFDRTSAQRVQAYFQRIGWNRNAAALLTRLVTTNGGLPQGAPTSPRLANLVNISLDRNIARAAARFNGTYTRYADDITISFPEDWPRKLLKVVHRVRHLAKGCGYEVHGDRKFGVYRQHQRQRVCGVVVNAKPALPREIRRKLRAVEHALRTGGPATMLSSQLSGWRAYERSLTKVTVPERVVRSRRRGTYRHLDQPVPPRGATATSTTKNRTG
jgi:hypothetical protein